MKAINWLNKAQRAVRSAKLDEYLLIFDLTLGRTWEEKIFREEHHYRNHWIVVWGM